MSHSPQWRCCLGPLNGEDQERGVAEVAKKRKKKKMKM